MTDPCQNPKCDFRPCCLLRPSEAHITDHEPQQLARPAPAADDIISFSVRHGPGCWIGELRVTGQIEKCIASALPEERLRNLAGLLVNLDSHGGSYKAGLALERFVLLARQQMPVLAFVIEAQSAALIPAVAAHVTCAAPDGIIGGFGQAFATCDGHAPKTIINRQSPSKYPAELLPLSPRMFVTSEEKRQRLQAMADSQHDLDLALLAGYAGVPADALRPVMDGRSMIAREGKKAGLVDRICDQKIAYEHLLTLIHERKSK